MAMNISRKAIIDSWSTIVENGAGQEQRLIDTTIQFINEAKMPNVTLYRDECFVVSGLSRIRRDLLILTHAHYRKISMFLGATAYGASLNVGWFLTFTPSFFSRKFIPATVDIFAQQDLRAFVSIAHHCMKKALEAVCEDLEQSPAGLNEKSTGFLSVW
jgi:hypothetical protein